MRTGPFVSCITSSEPLLAEGIALHYAEHAVETEFADFHVRIARPRNLRRWYRPQVRFYFDDAPSFHPLPADQAFPMLEWGLNWCVTNQAHRYLIIHAAVLQRQGKSLILPAPPGSGKSTLCAGLAHSGWRLLSDELALIDPDTGRVVPVPRPVSLKNRSIEILKAFAPQAVFNPTVSDTIKGDVAHMRAPPDALLRAEESAAPGWIVMPHFEAGAAPQLVEITRARGMMALIENAFNFDLHGRRGFDTLGDFVDQCRCYRYSYGSLADAIDGCNRLADAA
ncbi:MAG: HprK-related kinase A [Rhodocyclaceae bacterium]|nr:HprK-related kinase A [Rhodocyclaceae bacterium]